MFFIIAWWETPDGWTHVYNGYANERTMTEALNTFLAPDSSYNGKEVDTSTRELRVIEGEPLTIIPKEIIKEWTIKR